MRFRALFVRALVVATVLGLGSTMPPVHAHASGTVVVSIQTMDSCQQVLSGAAYLVSGNGTSTAVGPAWGGKPVTLSRGSGSCPLEGGNCVTVPNGCNTVTLPVPGSGSQQYSITQAQTPALYAACNGGSACEGQTATLTVDSGGGVRATVTNVYPDGKVAVYPAPDHNTGLNYFSGAATDPVLFHDFGIGPAICDGDNDADDQSTGTPSSDCDATGDRAKTLTIAGVAANGSMISAHLFGTMTNMDGSSPPALAFPPAIASTSSSASSALEIAVFTSDGLLHVRSDSASWTPLSGVAQSCIDAPSAYTDLTTKTLWVSCERPTHDVVYGTATVPSSGLPKISSWTVLSGATVGGPLLTLGSSPSIAPVSLAAQSSPTFYAIGTDGSSQNPTGTLWSRTVSTSWQPLGGQCVSRVSAALSNTAQIPATVVACRAATGTAQYGLVAQNGTFSGFAGAAATVAPQPAINAFSTDPGGILDAPAIASAPHGAIVLIAANGDRQLYSKAITFPTASTAPTPATAQVSWYQLYGWGPVSKGPAAAANPVTTPATVAHSATTTSLISSTSSTPYGGTVTFTATVSGPGGTPSGVVQFSDTGGVNLGDAQLAGGVSRLAIPWLTAGGHSITAAYVGNQTLATSLSPSAGVAVGRNTPTVAVTTSPNPSSIGQKVMITATLAAAAPGAAVPTGTATFMDGGTTLGSVVLGTGVASLSPSFTTGGPHSITAHYLGDPNYATATSGAVIQNVASTGAASQSTLASSANPAVVGQSITYTVTVAANPARQPVPTGTVTLADNGVTGAPTSLNALGIATFAVVPAAPGSHSLTATYGGDSTYAGSTSPSITEGVSPATTSVEVTSSGTPSNVGTPVTFSATVTVATPGTASPPPTGTVTFSDGATPIDTETLGATGVVAFTTATLTQGSHSITAAYTGDPSFLAAVSPPFAQLVPVPASQSLQSALTASVRSAVVGQSITYTVTVTPAVAGPPVPTGTATLTDNGVVGAPQALDSSGAAHFIVSAAGPGSHTLTATYSGDSTYTGSAAPAITEAVSMAVTQVALGSSANPSNVGNPVTFTATVTVVAPGAPSPPPTGTVTFSDGVTPIGTATLPATGVATITTSTLTHGPHAITAAYSGDALFSLSGSPTLSQTLTPVQDVYPGCTDYWTNPSGGSWSDGANWSTGVPGVGDGACVTLNSTYTVTLSGSTTVTLVRVGGVSGGPTLVVGSTCAQDAILTASGGITVGAPGTITLANADACGKNASLSGPVTNAGIIVGAAGAGGGRTLAGALTNNGQLVIQTATGFTASGTTLTNAGSIVVADGVSLTVSNGALFTNGAGGSITGTGTGNVTQAGGTFTEGAGSTSGTKPVIVDDGALVYSGSGAGLIALQGTSTRSGSIASGQTLSIESTCAESAVVTSPASFTNNGTMTLTNGDGCANNVTLTLTGSGAMTNKNLLQVLEPIGGTRTLNGSLTSSKVVSVGAGASFSVSGAFVQQGGGTFSTGIASASTFGSLHAGAPSTITGTVSLTAPFTPTPGQVFPIIVGTVTGTFTKASNDSLGSGLYYLPTYPSGGVSLVATQATLSLGPSSVARGGSLTVSGTAYPPSSSVTVTFTDHSHHTPTQVTATTDPAGKFSTSLVVPSTASTGIGTVAGLSTWTSMSITLSVTVT